MITLAITAPNARASRKAKWHREEPFIIGLAVCGRECRTRSLIRDPDPATLCKMCWPGEAA